MIGTLINLMIVLPLIVGMISVDINGSPTSIKEFLRSDLMQNATSILKGQLTTDNEIEESEEIEEEVEEEEKEPVQPLISINTPETDKIMDDLGKYVGDGVVYIAFNIKDFGVWLGVSTAPFHYGLAVLIAFSFLSPYNWLWIGAIFWVVTTERKEIYNIFKTGIQDAHLKTQIKSVAVEISSGIRHKLRKNKTLQARLKRKSE